MKGVPGGRKTSNSGSGIVVLEVSLIREFVGNGGQRECVCRTRAAFVPESICGQRIKCVFTAAG